MTLIEYDLYSKIRPRELCEGAWTKEDRYTTAPNLMNLAHRFNNMVWWIVTQIVQCKKPSKRETIIAKWIDIAHVRHPSSSFSLEMHSTRLRCPSITALSRIEQLQRSERDTGCPGFRSCGAP